MNESSQENKISGREFLVHTFLLLLLLIVAFPAVFFKGYYLSSADILYKVAPWHQYAPPGYTGPQNKLALDPITAFRPAFREVHDAVNRGEWPLWNPYEYAGMPLLANFQSTVLYPFHLPVIFTDVDTAMSLIILIKLWLCGMTAYLCGRMLFHSVAGARFFSVAWMLGGYCFVWAPWPLTDVSAWVPVVFMGAEFLVMEKYRRGFAAICMGGTLLVLAGHPETAFTMGVSISVYFVIRLLLKRSFAVWKPIVVWGSAWLVVVIICAPQIVPFLEYLHNSYTINHPNPKRFNEFFAFNDLVTFWVPRFYGVMGENTFWDMNRKNSNLLMEQYPGIAVWLGVGLLTTVHSSLKKEERSRLIALFIAALLGGLMAYRFPLVRFIQTLPLFWSLRQIYHIGFLLFALPLLGTMGLEAWFSRPRHFRESVWLLACIIFPFFYIAWCYFFNRSLLSSCHLLGYVQQKIMIAAVLSGISVTVIWASTRWFKPAFFWASLTLLLITDLLYSMHGLTPMLPKSQIFPEIPFTRFMEAKKKPCRSDFTNVAIPSGFMPNYKVEEWSGYDGIYPERVIDFQKRFGEKIWERMEPVCSIQYYADYPERRLGIPVDEMVASGVFVRKKNVDGVDIYRNTRAFPRAFLVGSIEPCKDRNEVFQKMMMDDFDPSKTVPTESPPPGILPRSQEKELGTVEITDYKSTHVRLRVHAKARSVLVLADAFYPGWKVRIDNTLSSVFPAYYAFRGVVVPEGIHTVEFDYHPASFWISLYVSLVLLLLCIPFSLLLFGTFPVYCAWDPKKR